MIDLEPNRNGYEKNHYETDAYGYDEIVKNSIRNGEKIGEKNCEKCSR
jgi:hypothetical protein